MTMNMDNISSSHFVLLTKRPKPMTTIKTITTIRDDVLLLLLISPYESLLFVIILIQHTFFLSLSIHDILERIDHKKLL